MSLKVSSHQVDGVSSTSEDPSARAGNSTAGPSRGMRKLKRICWNLLPPLTFVAIVAFWAAVVRLFDIPSYVLPGPGLVFSRLIEEVPQLWDNSLVTVAEIVWGFGLTILTAIPLGLVIALSPIAKQVVYPPLMFLQLVPKIAVAPLFLVWLGFGIESKILLTVLMTFFPLLLASMSGFQILDNRLLYLTKSMGASSWQTFRYLRLPAALPVIFSGIKTSATIAATAAIVAEFVGANKGLGYVLLRGTSTMDIGLTFAVIAVLTVIGIAINYIVEFAEWAMTPWQRSKQ
ncbi:ABC transporter permease [Paraburkholderia sp. Cy-641]|uniref:ABC transporter permease n=1 Tax=Paraburkholderia sp. Cy-641 TaxID=2608337 RepID=UPI00141EB5BA|nr:ABC transporter permease [Paraburkholderia sp. Cy-641]NIF75840.1 ABC transporter permease [Paraburkholderia sp. Cy-641]